MASPPSQRDSARLGASPSKIGISWGGKHIKKTLKEREEWDYKELVGSFTQTGQKEQRWDREEKQARPSDGW